MMRSHFVRSGFAIWSYDTECAMRSWFSSAHSGVQCSIGCSRNELVLKVFLLLSATGIMHD